MVTNKKKFNNSEQHLGMVDVLRKESTYSFDETVKRTEEALASEGFGHLLSKGLDEMFKLKLGVDFPRYTIILACAPELAKMGLEASLDVGTLYPCSFVVYEDKGKVMVSHTSIMRAASELELAPTDVMVPVIEETGKRVNKVWNKI
ncbi:DUF302 domain-containing protein [Candidatus Thorarchaeota archaeon]|nr:DUF302 domain-containing protein [Candidatus Thorarchaeota archaeon]TFG98400.1 MAG: DUF302 domain-containing protein [Candidatus Thorarchaeota archaeon]